MSKQETTGQEREALRRQMAIQRQVELHTNRLIQEMKALVDKQKVADGQMEKHQIKNLLAVALDTPSVEVVKHYILYQAGRDTSATSWRRNNFGDELVQAIDGLREDAKRITGSVHDGLHLGNPSADQIDEAWMLLLRAYLGQLNRYFYYSKEKTRWPPETR